MDDGEVFATVHGPLRRFAAVVRPPDVDVDDLVQEAVTRALRVGALADLDDPLVYLRRVVFRLVSNERRSFARRRDLDDRLGAGAGSAGPRSAVDAYPSDLADLVALPPDQRAVLYLHVVERASHDEIASMLAITPEASRARLSRGLKALRTRLDDQEVTP